MHALLTVRCDGRALSFSNSRVANARNAGARPVRSVVRQSPKVRVSTDLYAEVHAVHVAAPRPW